MSTDARLFTVKIDIYCADDADICTCRSVNWADLSAPHTHELLQAFLRNIKSGEHADLRVECIALGQKAAGAQ